jgi:hypothetical protein
MSGPMTEQPTAVQPAIFNALMESVTRRMANTLLCTGRSGVINTARDFSCSLVTARNELLSVSVQRAFGTLGAGVGMADASGSSLPPSCGVVSGFDRRADGAAFINVVILGAGGGPGTPVTDGWLTIACMGNAGMPFYDSVELDELHCPLISKDVLYL